MTEGGKDPASRLAGSDTREAASTQTVRRIAFASFLVAGPGWAAAFGATAMLGKWFAFFPSGRRAFATVFLIATGLASAIFAWRLGPPRQSERSLFPPGAGPLLTLLLLSVAVLATGDQRLAAMALPVVPATVGWFIGRGAGISAAACVPHVRPAAAGMVTMSALFGIVIAGPLAAVSDGRGFRWGAFWTIVILAWAASNFVRAELELPEDRLRCAARRDVKAGEATFSSLGITVAFGTNEVLKGTDLEAAGGELVALAGGNGAGKSTLLRVAAGLMPCRSGRVRVGGHDVTMLRPEERAEVGLAFVSGARPIFPDLTVLENLRVAAFQSHVGLRSFAPATDAIFDLVPALASRRSHRAGVLSGGEQRLLAVAQTLYNRPIALLADELSLGLALDARIAVLDLLRLLADEGVAVVCVDHDLPSLLPRSDRAVLLSDGVGRSFDKPVKLLDQRAALLPATFLVEVPR